MIPLVTRLASGSTCSNAVPGHRRRLGGCFVRGHKQPYLRNGRTHLRSADASNQSRLPVPTQLLQPLHGGHFLGGDDHGPKQRWLVFPDNFEPHRLATKYFDEMNLATTCGLVVAYFPTYHRPLIHPGNSGLTSNTASEPTIAITIIP